MGKKTLLLSANYEALSFIKERKTLKLLFKDKVDVISAWDESVRWVDGDIQYPSIVRLKSQIKRHHLHVSFSRAALVRRDRATCQYCNKQLQPSMITIDHVLPKSLGGGTNFSNCVVCCKPCNSKKSNKTPEMANMPLIRKPFTPSFHVHLQSKEVDGVWHSDWSMFLNNL